ncbi:response regulator of citrate/malate metabolism [Nocardioides albertanoniae]|uniref:Transcriptional regulatory protein n=1 Tax=Nocardioides albertanoniae TaxID=1175486 RepID=A0A543A6A9_9ACTN|nr:response regulator [Nocardioides albertanoniae]TQL68110.1 response regulator of citrate/malate metabolism [Nocardioides albertanoniae]
MSAVRVLVIEDEELAAEAHAAYVERVSGFGLAGVARSAREAARALDAARDAGTPVDLVLLDMNLPDGHGLGFLSKLRAAGHLCDVIAVTAARDTRVVRQAVAQGVVLYLLKPFTFATFRDKLEQYADFRARLDAAPEEVVQHEVDQLLGSLRPTGAPPLPKGMSPETLRAVTAALREADHELSASEVAAAVGASRVTARRYLEHLADTGSAARGVRYGPSGGRPEVSYSWGRGRER